VLEAPARFAFADASIDEIVGKARTTECFYVDVAVDHAESVARAFIDNAGVSRQTRAGNRTDYRVSFATLGREHNVYFCSIEEFSHRNKDSKFFVAQVLIFVVGWSEEMEFLSLKGLKASL
jgi:hypothetical protein